MRAQKPPADKAPKGHARKVWVYVDPRKGDDDPTHLKIFASMEAAAHWLEQHDPEGVAYECEVQT
jgi:hypothetical protein